MPDCIVTGSSGIAKRCDAIEGGVLDIEYWNLIFICILVLDIWDLIIG